MYCTCGHLLTNDSAENRKYISAVLDTFQCDSKAATLQMQEIEVGAALCPAEEISRSSCSPASIDPIREAEIAFIRTYGRLFRTMCSREDTLRISQNWRLLHDVPQREKLKLATNISGAEAEMRLTYLRLQIKSSLQPVFDQSGSGPNGNKFASKDRPQERMQRLQNVFCGLLCWLICSETQGHRWLIMLHFQHVGNNWLSIFKFAFATLRFDDHRGITTSEVTLSSSGLNGRLTRIKVPGPDKRHNFRLLVVHPSAFIHHKDWFVAGWRLLEKEAPHTRDYILPAPTNNFRGLKRKELSYQTAFAVQSQMISLASYLSTGHYYTSHSGRNFMPSATSVLNFARGERDMLGGWASEGSERYSRAAKYKIELMQQCVSNTFKSPEHDLLAEADDLDALGTFLKSWDVPDEEALRTKTLLLSRTFSCRGFRTYSVDYFVG